MNIDLTFVFIIQATLMLIWLFFLVIATNKNKNDAKSGKIIELELDINNLKSEEKEMARQLKQMHDIKERLFKKFIRKFEYRSIIKKIEKKSRKIKKVSFPVLVIPGYRILNIMIEYNFIGFRFLRGKIVGINEAFLLDKDKVNLRTDYIIAKMLSTFIFYTFIALFLMVFLIANFVTSGTQLLGTIIMVVIAPPFFAYLFSCNKLLADYEVKKDAIITQLPNVLTKLALLTGSVYEPQNAWDEVAKSMSGELYKEMLITTKDIEALKGTEVSYKLFSERCKMKEVSKLAALMQQSMVIGNIDLSDQLREMAHEAWVERKNLAKRKAERANMLMLVPVLIMFIVVIMVVIAPIMISMGDM